MPLAFFVTVLLAYAPYASVGAGVAGFLPDYFQEEGLQQGWGIFLLKAVDGLGYEVPAKVYLGVAAAVLVLVGIWFLSRRRAGFKDSVVAATAMALAFTLLLSPHYPWYFLWLLPMLCLQPYPPALFLTVTSFALYEILLRTSAAILFRINVLLYLPFVVLALSCWWISRGKPVRAELTAIGFAEEDAK
jgi:hypothetical protein